MQAELRFNQVFKIYMMIEKKRTGTHHILHSENNKTDRNTGYTQHSQLPLSLITAQKKLKEDYKHECMDDAAASTEYTQLKTTQFHP